MWFRPTVLLNAKKKPRRLKKTQLITKGMCYDLWSCFLLKNPFSYFSIVVCLVLKYTLNNFVISLKNEKFWKKQDFQTSEIELKSNFLTASFQNNPIFVNIDRTKFGEYKC